MMLQTINFVHLNLSCNRIAKVQVYITPFKYRTHSSNIKYTIQKEMYTIQIAKGS